MFREGHPYDGSIINRGMTEADWERLHGRVIPNPISMDAFKEALRAGTLQKQYLAKDLHKIMQELREILREHGELREAANFPLSGRKADLSQAAAAAVLLLSQRVAAAPSADSTPHLRRPDADSDTPASPTLQTLTEDILASPTVPKANTPQRALQFVRQPPITGHIQDELLAPHLPSVVPARTVPPTLVPGEASQAVPIRWQTKWSRLSATIAANAASPLPPSEKQIVDPTRTVPSSLAPTAAPVGVPAAPPTGALSTSEDEKKSTGAVNELALLNERSPPFAVVVSVVRRFQLRYGSHQLKFEVPVQYAEAVAARRLRLHVIPLRHPNHPARWPSAKEIVVYVNDQCVMTPWRRTWPERKVEVAKTFLPLDLTQFINSSLPHQRLQADIFGKEYFTPALLAVVQLYDLVEVVERTLSRVFGEYRLLVLTEALLRPTPRAMGGAAAQLTERLAALDVETQRFYAHVQEEELEDGLEMSNPVITTKCPISQMPLRVPVRGSLCRHLQCVDLESYLVSCHKGSYWNCALCDSEMRPTDVRVDTTLWRCLAVHHELQQQAGSQGRPLYLKLHPLEGGTASGRYEWRPSTSSGAEGDVVLDNSEEDESEQPTTAGLLASGSTAAQVHSVQKRPREESPPAMEGSADNPIEL